MALPWTEVIKKPEFQALSQEDQEAARNEYFNDVVAPHVPAESIMQARQEFDADTSLRLEPIPAETKPEPTGDTVRGFKRAFAQIPELAYGTGALAAMSAEKLFGEGGLSTAAKDFFARKYQEKQVENQQYAPTVEFTGAWDSLKNGDLGPMADWLQDSAGYVVGQGIQTVATGGAGALIGKAVGKTATEKLLGSMVAKSADKIVANSAGRIGIEQATRMSAERLAAAIGAGVALQAQNLGMEAGDIYGGLMDQARQEGREVNADDLWRAWGSATAAALTETATDLLGLGAATGRIKIGGKSIQSMKGLSGHAVRAGIAAGVGMPVEGSQEYVQTLLEQIGAGTPTDTEAARNERINAAAVGAVGGGLVGGAAGAVARPQPELEIAKKVTSAPTLDAAIQAASEAASGTTPVLGGHVSGAEVLPVTPEISGTVQGTPILGMGASGAEMLEPDYGQNLAQVGERMYESRGLINQAMAPTENRKLPVVQPPRVIVTPEGTAATETQLAQQQAAKAAREQQLGITPDIRQQIETTRNKNEPTSGITQSDKPAAKTVSDIHALADEKHIAYDNDPDFMEFTRGITGKQHLDELTDAEIQAVHAKLAERPAQKHKYSSSQVAVKGDIGLKLRQAAKKLIAAEDVHPEEGLEKRPHITLKYGLRTEAAADLEKVLAGEGPITATVGNIEIFQPENEDYDVVVARVESPELTRLNKKVSDALPNVSTHPDYKPHITLGYVKKGTGQKYANAKTGLEGKTLTFNAVEFGSKDGTITPIELKGQPVVTDEQETTEDEADYELTQEEKDRAAQHDQLKKDKAFRRVLKEAGDPHIDSPVAHDFMDGWLDQKAGKEPNKRYLKHVETKGKGYFDPINPYMMGYAAARDGKVTKIRASDVNKMIAGETTEPTPPETTPTTTETPPAEPKLPESTSAKAEKARRTAERIAYTEALDNSEILEEAKGDIAAFTKNADQIVRAWLMAQQKEAVNSRDNDRAAAIGKILKDGLPADFYQSLHKAAQKKNKEAALEAARDPEVYKAALAQAMTEAKVEDAEAFRQGWDHAIKGKTKSTLPSGETLDAGYKAAQKWLKTEEGRNYYEGKRGKKLENTGVALRRWFDGAKQKLSDAAGVNELLREIETSTSRAEMFANVAGEGATPGTIYYLNKLRDDIIPFKEWLSDHGPLRILYGAWAKQRASNERLLNYLNGKSYQSDKKDATTEERIAVVKEAAQKYIDTVGELVQAFQGVKTVTEAAERFDKLFVAARERQGETTYVTHKPTKFSENFSNFWRGRWSVWMEYLPNAYQVTRIVEKEHDTTINDGRRKQPLTPPRLDRVTREGLKDYRKGKDITPKKFKETFGFADVGFGKWVGTRQDQDHLNYAYDAFMDLADLLGIKPKDISLGGTLHFTIGALGHGKHAAHFAPNQPHPDGGTVPVINLTNTKGDGTLAHEWHHALDNHLKKSIGTNAVDRVVSELKTAYDYAAIRSSAERMLRGNSWFSGMKKDGPIENARYAIGYYAKRQKSNFYQEASKLDGGNVEKPYWSNDAELFARASEAFVMDKLEGMNDYLVNPQWAGDGKIKPPMYRGTPYPESDERKRFNEVFDAFHKSLDWTDAGPRVNLERFQENLPKYNEEFQKALDDLRSELPEMLQQIRHESMAKRLAEEAEANRMFREEQEKARLEAESAAQTDKPSPPPVGELTDDEISAAFDQAAAELQESTQEKPKAPQPGEPTLPAKSKPATERTVSGLAADAAKLGVKGIDEALKGLVELFGGGKIKSFPAGFDEEAYQKAKPHFEAALEAFQDAGKTLVDLFKFLIEKFGLGIRPYAERFAKDQKLSMGLANAPSASRQIANWVKNEIQDGNDIRWQDLFEQSDKAYGGTQAEGKYTVKDAYDAMEAGVNLYIKDGNIKPASDIEGARRDIRNLSRLLDGLPTQTKRTGEMDEFQQFSTPPTLAYAAAWAANIRYGESMLEPSAGIGGLAIFADLAGARVTLNELSSRRAAVLKEVLPNARVFQENAEQLHNVLPDDVTPSVIVMNPPFSATAGRMEGARKTAVGAQHIEQALKRLAKGGRLVAIVGEGMGADKPGFRDWWKQIQGEYNVRANIGVSGKNYAKYGTTFDNQLLIIDKNGPTTGQVVTGKADTIEELVRLIEGVRNDRPATDQAGEPVAAQPGGTEVPAEGVAGQGGVARPEPDALGAGQRPGDRTAPSDTPNAGKTGGADQSARADETQPGAQVPDRSGRGGRAGRGRTGTSGRSGAGGGPAVGDTAQQYGGDSEVKLEQAEKQKAEGEITEAIFEAYTPQRLKVAGAKPHPGKLVQSAAMAAVEPPAPTYTPNLPREVITEGKLSLAQIEAVVYAGQAHQQTLPDGSRRGFFIGDGTGVGKGREIAGIILDNLRQGRKKAVWISEKRGLFKDAGRDFAGVGGDKTLLFQHHKFPATGKVSPKGGILFSTYSMLRSGEKKQITDKDKTPGKTRVAQLVEWLGQDFDGVIVFDESHNMANAVQTKGKRGKKEASKQAQAGIELQRLLPKARVVYVSATGATEVENLVYAQRLGLWGEGTAFSGANDFITKVETGGVAAMELVARDLKALGAYIARSLSFDGVTYERLEHELTPLQTDIYNELAKAWGTVLQNINQALEATLQGKNGNAKSAAMSRFWSTEQRFFNQVITSMQMPTILEDARKRLDNGEAVVLQLVNTNEAEQERQVARAEQEDIEIEELDFTPRQALMDYVRLGFPVQQYEEYKDEEGNTHTRPVFDSQGKPVINKEMVEKRDALLKTLEDIRVPDNPIDIILETFGPKMVGEVTGRSRRFYRQQGEDGEFKMVEEKRTASAAQADAQAFMDDQKRVLVFSDAGGTGYSFHADKTQTNQRRRYHYLVQPGWRADKAVQGFGRTHRTNEASQPHYVLPTTNLKAQKRFISSIARRLDQLGALTKGQRQASGQGLFNAADNLESKYAAEAMQTFFEDLYAGRTPLDLNDTLRMMGLDGVIDAKTGALNQTKIPSVPQFLNRLLALTTDKQNEVFDEFFNRMEELVHNAIQKGTYDQGVETLKALKVHKLRDEVAYTDPRTGAETRYVELETTLPTEIHDWDAVQNRADLAKKDFAGYFRNNKTGKVFAIINRGVRTGADGRQLHRALQIHVSGPHRYIDNADTITDPKIRENNQIKTGEDGKTVVSHYEELTQAEAQEAWAKELETAPKTHTKTVHMIAGAILPIWDRVSGQPKVIRTQTDEGERLLGRVVAGDDLKATLRNLGIGSSATKMTPAQVLKRIQGGDYALLANGWQIREASVSGDDRIEITAPSFSPADRKLLEEQGAFIERIQWRERVFIPTGDQAEGVLGRIIKSKPVVEIIERGGKAEFSLASMASSLAARLKPDKTRQAIISAVDSDFEGIVNRMKKAGVLEIECD